MRPANIPIGTISATYMCGELRWPEIQRRYFWGVTLIRDLFDSLLWADADFLSYQRQVLADRMNSFTQEKSLA